MKRWLLLIPLVLAIGIGGALLLSRPDLEQTFPPGKNLSSNALARVRVAGGGHHALVIAPDGSLWSLGDNASGSAMGLGAVGNVPKPKRVGQDNDWQRSMRLTCHRWL